MVKKLKDLQNKKGKKGFSMIELIIVIAIMAILVALIGTQLIPYLEKSRESRDKTTLDTILTSYQSVVAEYEFSLPDGNSVTLSSADAWKPDSDMKEQFEKYAGLSDTDKPFKSDKVDKNKAKTYGDVKITYTDDGVIEKAEVGSLEVSTSKN